MAVPKRHRPSGTVRRVYWEDVETLRGAYEAFNEGGGIAAILERERKRWTEVAQKYGAKPSP